MQINKSELAYELKTKAQEFELAHPVLAGMAVGAASGLVATAFVKLLALPAIVAELAALGFTVASINRHK
jgi:ribose/xylose/arabinose/galactoside ABC-type transport system permease subunit